MFAIERQNKIKEMLYKDKRVDVIDLSKLFGVTEVTIRRDLDKLEQDGFLIKTYGGAVLNEDVLPKARPGDSDDAYIEEKRMIGRMAAQMIDNYEAIYLSPGTTCLEIAKNLHEKRLTVVTNDLMIAQNLKDAVGIKVIVTGGDLLQSTTTLTGALALQALSNIYIYKAFIGVTGVNFTTGFTVDSHEEVALSQGVIRITNDIIIVADYSKFNCTAFARLGDLGMARKIITNKQVPNEYKKYFFEHSVKLFTAYEFE